MRHSEGVAWKRSRRNFRCAQAQTSRTSSSFSASRRPISSSYCRTQSSPMKKLLSYTMNILEATGVMGPTFGFTISLVTLSMAQSWSWSALVAVLVRLRGLLLLPLWQPPSNLDASCVGHSGRSRGGIRALAKRILLLLVNFNQKEATSYEISFDQHICSTT